MRNAQKYIVGLFSALSLTLLVATPSWGMLITSDTSLIPLAPSVIDFSEFSGPSVIPSGIVPSGIVQIGTPVGEDITWQTNISSSLIGDTEYGFGFGSFGNGKWDIGRNGFTGLNAFIGDMDYTFANAVSGVGGFINYMPGNGLATISALNSGGGVLESYVIETLAPITLSFNTLNGGAFRGIQRSSNDIYGFRVSNNSIGLDDLEFARVSTVPLPPALPMFFSGLVGIGLVGRKRRKRRAA